MTERYWTSGFDFAAQLKTASSPLKKRISRRTPSATAVNKTTHVNLDQQSLRENAARNTVFTTVTETTQNYTCAEELHHVQSEYAMKSPDCDQYWSAQDHSIATFLQSTPECHSPCKEVFGGRIVLTDCINISLAVICTRDYLTEYRVHFYGERVPQPLINPVNRGHTGIFLPITLVVIAIVVCLLCVAYAYKNNRSNVQATDMG
ncbi:hypothetical protein cypCar_00023889 [Cyprinus carpio]|nr:hypothetical protein cypCar_00023889 [Cyprinus carpio]